MTEEEIRLELERVKAINVRLLEENSWLRDRYERMAQLNGAKRFEVEKLKAENDGLRAISHWSGL